MQPVFDDGQLLQKLNDLSARQQLVFGASCCERMLPNYETFAREVGWRAIEPLRTAMNVVWAACRGDDQPEATLRAMLSECEECAPDSDDFTSLFVSSAQDAVFAVCSLLDFLLGGDAECIVSVARFATDSVDLIVQENEAMDPRDPQRERRILEHPLMQQELSRQRRDLADASQLASERPAALARIRRRGELEANLHLDEG